MLIDSDEIRVLKILVRKLDSIDIPYMISGSIAANFYAQPRMTRDIDLVIELSEEKISLIYDSLKKDFYIDKDVVRRAASREGMFNVIHNETLVKVDFIIKKKSEYRLLEFRRKIKHKINDTEICLVSPEDLILSKLYWARDSLSEIQLRDARNILKGVENIDREYMENWARKLNIIDLLESIQ